jgi:hypothetical protein
LAVTTATDFGVSKPTTTAGGGGAAAPAEGPLLHPSKALDAITVTSKPIWIFMKQLPAENDFEGPAAPLLLLNDQTTVGAHRRF